MYFIAEILKMPSVAAGSATQPILCLLECDTVSDLPAQPATGYNWIVGSKAHVVQDNTMYAFKSTGTWVIQDEASRMNVYTKDETDDLLLDYASVTDVDEIHDAVVELVDESAKNKLKLTGSDVTGYGIACTFDADAGTIYLDGVNQDKKCTGSFNIQISDSRTLGLIAGDVYHFSCDGYDTNNDTIGIYVYTSGATPLTQFDCYNNNEAAWNSAWEQASGFRLFIRSGTVVDNVTLKPMICTKAKWDMSHNFVPYYPTLEELYAIVRNL